MSACKVTIFVANTQRLFFRRSFLVHTGHIESGKSQHTKFILLDWHARIFPLQNDSPTYIASIKSCELCERGGSNSSNVTACDTVCYYPVVELIVMA